MAAQGEGGERATRRFIDESGGCCTAAFRLVGHRASVRACVRAGVGSYGSDVTSGIVLRR